MKVKPFYIAYFHSGFPGGAGDLHRFDSLSEAKSAFRGWSGESWVTTDGASASLYWSDNEEDWAEAQEFETVGCPFDYPSYLLNIGPRGGVLAERC